MKPTEMPNLDGRLHCDNCSTYIDAPPGSVSPERLRAFRVARATGKAVIAFCAECAGRVFDLGTIEAEPGSGGAVYLATYRTPEEGGGFAPF